MLGLLLTILKIIGLILLAVLGLILLLVFVILLVPIRYRGRGSYYGKPEGSLRVTWLMHLLSVEASYRDQFQLVVRVLGFQLFKEKGEKAKEDLIEEPILAAQEVTEELFDPKVEQEIERETEGAAKDRGSQPIESGGADNDGKANEPSQEALLQELREEIDSLKSEIHSLDEAEQPAGGGMDHTPAAKAAPKKKNPFVKLYERICGFFRRLKLSFRLLSDRVRLLLKKKEELTAFLRDEENKKTFCLLKKLAFKLLRHILPRKLEGEVTFGFEDPYITGQILTGAALFYPLYHKHLFLTPVFDVDPGRTVLEGKLFFKGRIRMGTFLAIGLRLLLHKNFRVLLKKFLNQGGN